MLTFSSPSDPFFFAGRGKGKAAASAALSASHFTDNFEVVESQKPNGRKNFATYAVTDHLTHRSHGDEKPTGDGDGAKSAADTERANRLYSINASSDLLSHTVEPEAKGTGKKTSGYTQLGHFNGGDCVVSEESRRPSRRILHAPVHFDGYSLPEDVAKPSKKKGEFSRAKNDSHFVEGFAAEDTDVKTSGKRHSDAKPVGDHFSVGFVAHDPEKPSGRARPETHARGSSIGSGLVPTQEPSSPKKAVNPTPTNNLQTSLVPTDDAEHVKPGKGRAPADITIPKSVVLGGCLPLEDERIPRWKLNAMKARGEDPSEFIAGPAVNDVFSPWKTGRSSDAKLRPESPLRGIRYQARPSDNPNILTWQ